MSVRCATCKKIKPLELFPLNARARNGHNSTCKECNQAINARKAEARRAIRANDPAAFQLRVKKYLLSLSKRRALEKKLEHTITIDDFEIPDKCPILEVPLTAYRGGFSPASYSLDRVDSSKGYIPGNVRVISWRANVLKSSLTLEEAERLVRYIKGEV